MNLTDDQLRSLRAAAEKEIAFHREHHDHNLAWWARPVLSLVEEVERLRRFEGVAKANAGLWKEALDTAHTDLDLRENEVIALAAKAKAGKGLYEALRDRERAVHEAGRRLTLTEQALFEGRIAAALARWEAVENG